ncbi:MAG: 4Fe-4S ferredoxin [Thermodesulfatator sp.]|nr:MAG: 4Fe-4S ferredoxin [Thermodesulfatator sp.]
MASRVFWVDLRLRKKASLLEKVSALLSALEIKDRFRPGALVGIKLHFGEAGNLAHLRPQWVRRVVDHLKELGVKPFLTDTNTLYRGSRSDAVSHLETAVRNGFTYAVVGAPVVIADGLRGSSYEKIEMDFPVLKEFFLAKEVVRADGLVVLTHFKGHELSGFGGALKNVGMGCAARRGKLEQHSTVAPKIDKKRCVACGTCAEFCPVGAPEPAPRAKKPRYRINEKRCIGCGECIAVCPQEAIKVQWNEKAELFMRKMAEYAAAVLLPKRGRAFFLNFVLQVSPACDCYPFNDYPLVPDLGILASEDPVALDQASVDLVNQAGGLPGSKAEGSPPGEDKFRRLYPQIPWEVTLNHAEEIGLGSRKYELVKLEA